MLHTVQTVKPTEALRFVIFDYIYIKIDITELHCGIVALWEA